MSDKNTIKAGEKHRGSIEKSRANLRPPWKPGQSGNPKGRPPKLISIISLVKEELEGVALGRDGKPLKNPDGSDLTKAQVIAKALVKLAADGNATALKELLERVDGRVPLPLQHTGPTGGPVEIEFGSQKKRLQAILKDPRKRSKALEVARELYGDEPTTKPD